MGIGKLFATYAASEAGRVILAAFAGMLAAFIVAVYNRCVLGAFIHSLIGKQADSPESAAALPELRSGGNVFVKLSLRRRGSGLRRLVEAVPVPGAEALFETEPQTKDDEGTVSYGEAADTDEFAALRKEKKKKREKHGKKKPLPPLSKSRFYLPADKREKAASLYGEKRANPVLVIVSGVVFVAALYLILVVLPAVTDIL